MYNDNSPANTTLDDSFDVYRKVGHIHVPEFDKAREEWLEGIEDKVVLDIGCGYGSAFIAFLKQQDRQPKQLIHADRDYRVLLPRRFPNNYTDKIDYPRENNLRLKANGLHLPFADESINIVHQSAMLWDNMDFADEIEEEIARVLKADGWYVAMPSPPPRKDLFEMPDLSTFSIERYRKKTR